MQGFIVFRLHLNHLELALTSMASSDLTVDRQSDHECQSYTG